MLMQTGPTTFTAGSLDVHLILHNKFTGRYHPAFFEEQPLPGPVKPSNEEQVVRLRSKMHHTAGFETLEEAQIELDNMSRNIAVPEENVWRDPQEWDGHYPIVILANNWRADKNNTTSEDN